MSHPRHTIKIFITLLFLFFSAQHSSAAKFEFQKSIANYQIPDVVLTNQDGKKVPLIPFLDSEKPVMLEFIFATCTTICPVMSVSFTNLQRRLGKDTEKLRLVSVSIDPEHDTPSIMNKYLNRYNAQNGWDFLTGSKEDIDLVMKAFDAYVSDKMNHQPLTFMRSPEEKQWVRVNGFLSGKEMMKEYQKLIGQDL